MPLNNAAMIVGATAIKNVLAYAQAHSGAPGTNNTANVCTGPRKACSWTTPTGDGDFDLAATIVFTGIAAGGAVQWVTLWGSISGGTTYGAFQLVGDLIANSSGEFSLTSLPQNGSAS